MDFFSDSLARLKHHLRVSKDGEVAAALGLSKTAFSERKKRGSFPEKELRALADLRPDLGIDVDYVLTGTSPHRVRAAVSTLGRRIRQLRAERSPGEFCEAFGVTPEELRRIETGVELPSPELVMRLVEAHPNEDALWILTGQSPSLDGELSPLEIILIENYRASSEEGQEMLRRHAAACAEYHAKADQR